MDPEVLVVVCAEAETEIVLSFPRWYGKPMDKCQDWLSQRGWIQSGPPTRVTTGYGLRIVYQFEKNPLRKEIPSTNLEGKSSPVSSEFNNRPSSLNHGPSHMPE